MGPGRYVPESCVLPSEKTNFPRWTLPKAGRAIATNDKPLNNRNQTYDTRSGFRGQVSSKNPTAKRCTFGTSHRGQAHKEG